MCCLQSRGYCAADKVTSIAVVGASASGKTLAINKCLAPAMKRMQDLPVKVMGQQGLDCVTGLPAAYTAR